MNTYQIWEMPEEKEKGNHSKWIESEILEAKNRKEITNVLSKSHKNGTWKLRKV